MSLRFFVLGLFLMNTLTACITAPKSKRLEANSSATDVVATLEQGWKRCFPRQEIRNMHFNELGFYRLSLVDHGSSLGAAPVSAIKYAEAKVTEMKGSKSLVEVTTRHKKLTHFLGSSGVIEVSCE